MLLNGRVVIPLVGVVCARGRWHAAVATRHAPPLHPPPPDLVPLPFPPPPRPPLPPPPTLLYPMFKALSAARRALDASAAAGAPPPPSASRAAQLAADTAALFRLLPRRARAGCVFLLLFICVEFLCFVVG